MSPLPHSLYPFIPLSHSLYPFIPFPLSLYPIISFPLSHSLYPFIPLSHYPIPFIPFSLYPIPFIPLSRYPIPFIPLSHFIPRVALKRFYSVWYQMNLPFNVSQILWKATEIIISSQQIYFDGRLPLLEVEHTCAPGAMPVNAGSSAQ